MGYNCQIPKNELKYRVDYIWEEFMLELDEIERAILRIKATMEIEGFELSKYELGILEKVGLGKLNSDDLINKYIKRVSKISGLDNNED